MSFKVNGQWLCEEDGNIAYRPLRFWFEHFGLKPLEGHQCFWLTGNGKPMVIERKNGYDMKWEQYNEYKDRLFFVANADLNMPKLREKG